MSQLRPPGLKAPAKVARPSGVAPPKTSSLTSKPLSQDGQVANDVRVQSGTTPDNDGSTTSDSSSIIAAEPKIICAEFKFGDHVWVAGSKPGVIAYIGETQFAPGEWAGVVLDEPIGKNDGSVNGVRYFSCKPLFGIFSKLSNLTYNPAGMSSTDQPSPQSKQKQGDSTASSDNSILTSKGCTSDEPANVVVQKPAGSLNRTSNMSDVDAANAASKTSLPSGLARLTNRASSSSLGKLSSIPGSVKGTVGFPSADGGSSLPGGIKKTTTTVSADGSAASASSNLQIGCKVIVSGNKRGTLRFLGSTHFAKGEWAGVELNEPQGKNDGAVEGKRYFSCTPMYGLFAPLSKVSLDTTSDVLNDQEVASPPQPTPAAAAAAVPRAIQMAAPSSVQPAACTSQLTKEQSGSRDSLSSMSSVHSSASRSRVRLGISSTSAVNNMATKLKTTPHLLSSAPSPSNATTLQKALKEKEEHIQQLLIERDLERSEMAQMASRLDEAEGQLSVARVRYDTLVAESEDRIQLMVQTVEKLELEKTELRNRLDEEKRKVDDLQFAVEEAAIDDGDLKLRAERDERRLHELENQLALETERSYKLQQHLNNVTDAGDTSTTITQLEDDVRNKVATIERMTEEQASTEKQLSSVTLERNKLQEEVGQLTKCLSEKTDEVKQSESAAVSQNSIVSNLTAEIETLRSQLDERQFETSDLQCQLDGFEVGDEKLRDKLNVAVNSQHRVEELNAKLEKQLSELISSSGDNSQQLDLMNKELSDRNRTISSLQTQIEEERTNSVKISSELESVKVSLSVKTTELSDLSAKYNSSIETESEMKAENSRLMQTIEKLESDKSAREAEVDRLKAASASLASSDETLTAQCTALKGELLELKTALADANEENRQKSAELQSLSSTVEGLSSQLQEKKDRIEKLEEQLSKDEFEKSELATEMSHLQSLNKLLEHKITELQQQKQVAAVEDEKTGGDVAACVQQIDKLRDDNLALTDAKTNLEKKLSEVSEQLNMECELRKKLELEKQKYSDELSEAVASSTDTKRSQNELVERISELELVKQTLLSENESLSSELKCAVEKEQQSKELMTDIAALKTRLADTERMHQNKIRSMEAENSSLLQSVSSQKQELCVKQASLEKMSEEADKLKTEILLLNQKLDAARSSTDKNMNIEARDGSQEEIQFLNSVIVNLQSKNNELQAKLDGMVYDDVDVNLHNMSGDGSDVALRMSAPRLFCDICDVFDQHDTEDCPVQALTDSPPHGSSNAIVTNSRPYCDICEVFGHWSEDCDDQQTF